MQVVVVVTIVVSVVVGSHSSLSVYWVVPTHFLLVSFKCFDKVREILDAVQQDCTMIHVIQNFNTQKKQDAHLVLIVCSVRH